ncbi:MAG: hypothetical protein M3463_03085 [Verrucomicrobiota bacterium]|nr:hypothetical protein [Verrucomicrobiota bacterium]
MLLGLRACAAPGSWRGCYRNFPRSLAISRPKASSRHPERLTALADRAMPGAFDENLAAHATFLALFFPSAALTFPDRRSRA